MAWRIIEILNNIAAFQLLLFSFFLFSHKKRGKLSNRILAVFLLSLTLSLVHFILSQFCKNIYVYLPQIYWFSNSFVFLWGPALYFYTKSLAYRDFSLKKKHILHLIPFVLYWGYKIVDLYILKAQAKKELLLVGKIFNAKDIIIIGSLLNLPLLIYIIVIVRTLRAYHSEIKEMYSTIENINLSWLRFILISFGLIWIGVLANPLIALYKGYPSIILSYINLICIFVVANIIVYKGLKQPEIFTGILEKPKYEKSTLTKEDAESYLKNLKTYMEKEKPYLTPALNLNEMANKLEIPSRHLSQVINELLKQNFFDFINSYRIEEAKNILADSSNSNKTILEVIFEVGFNTKSSFNYAFKKHTGMTPSEYRRSHQI